MSRRTPLRVYRLQVSQAKFRGVPWQITFEEWVEWWGPDIIHRGGHGDALVMARYEDEGPYHLDNIYKTTMRQNSTRPEEKGVR